MPVTVADNFYKRNSITFFGNSFTNTVLKILRAKRNEP